MCGRFALSITPAQFQSLFGCLPPGLEPRFNITPDRDIVVVRAGDGGREAAYARWGLLGPWMSEAASPGRQINARIESAAEKPMFRSAFRRRRCLVPADGFYEWQKLPAGPRQPWFVRAAGGGPLVFAGLWWRSRLADGSELDSCAILTREAVPAIRDIHHRMPVLLAPELWDAWLDPGSGDPALLHALLADAPEVAIEAVPVSRRVNDPRNDDPGLVEPLDDHPPAAGPRPAPLQRSLF